MGSEVGCGGEGESRLRSCPVAYRGGSAIISRFSPRSPDGIAHSMSAVTGRDRSGGSDGPRAGDRGSGHTIRWFLSVVWLCLVVLWMTWTPLQRSPEPNPLVLFPPTEAFELLANAI